MTSPNYAENNSIENTGTKISNMISRLKMGNIFFFTFFTEEFPSTVVRVHDLSMPIEISMKEKPAMVDNDIQVGVDNQTPGKCAVSKNILRVARKWAQQKSTATKESFCLAAGTGHLKRQDRL